MAASLEDLRAGDFFVPFASGEHYRDASGAVAERAMLGRFCLIRPRGSSGAPEYAAPIAYLIGSMFMEPTLSNSASAGYGQPAHVTFLPTRLRPAPSDGSVVHFFGSV